MKIGAVTGLAAEAKIARRLGMTVAVAGGGGRDGTERALSELRRAGVTAIVSFGIAGALASSLRSGALVIPDAVVTEDGSSMPVDMDWQGRLIDAANDKNIAVTLGGILGADAVIATAAEKYAWFRSTAAIAVDLESLHVAIAAERARLPFVIVRTIADSAHRNLPAAALLPLKGNGKPRLGAVLGSLAKAPGQLPALIAVARETGTAMSALRRAAKALAPVLVPVSDALI
jgi:hopanoid-associated phosphorylase